MLFYDRDVLSEEKQPKDDSVVLVLKISIKKDTPCGSQPVMIKVYEISAKVEQANT